jgi:hypothetical protein
MNTVMAYANQSKAKVFQITENAAGVKESR